MSALIIYKVVIILINMDTDKFLQLGLTAFAIVLATYAVISFTSIELFSSPVTLSLCVLLIAFLSHLILSETGDETLVYAGYIIMIIYSLSVVLYIVSVLSLGPAIRSLLLVISSATILAGVYSIRQDLDILSRNVLIGIVILLVVLSGVSIGLDVLSQEPTDSINALNDTRISDDGEDFVVAEIEATNPSLLPKSYDSTGYVSCLSEDLSDNISDNERTDRVRGLGFASISKDIIWSSQSKEMKIPLREIPSEDRTSINIVEADGCPNELENNTIAVYPS